MKRNNRPIKTLQEIEKEQEKEWKMLKYTIAVFVAIVTIILILSIPFMFSSCTQPVKADNAGRVSVFEENSELRAIIVAYNHVLHRVWIDRPNYVEDALMETDEFQELNDLMFSQWEDTFSFYNEEDSIEYHRNWKSGDGRFDYDEDL